MVSYCFLGYKVRDDYIYWAGNCDENPKNLHFETRLWLQQVLLLARNETACTLLTLFRIARKYTPCFTLLLSFIAFIGG